MVKGTASMGKYNKPIHIRCRRCGRHSFHKSSRRCSYCGYPSPKWRSYNWLKPKKL